MITNERQYRIAKSRAQEFSEAISSYDIDNVISAGLPREIAQAQYDQMVSQYEELQEEIKEYDDLSSGRFVGFDSVSLKDLPIVLIKARIARGWTQKELAERLGVKEQQIQRYESDKYASCKLSTLNSVAELLDLNITESVSFIDELGELCEKFPFTEVFNKGWFPDYKGSLNSAKKSCNELVHAFYLNSGVTQNQLALHRKKVRAGGSINEVALSAWQARVMYLTQFQKLPTSYNPGTLVDDWFRELVKLSVYDDGPVRAMYFLLSSGIHFIVESHLKHTHLDGAALRHSDGVTPIVACTLRHDRLDNFWFVLLHELAHVRLHFDSGSVDYFDNDIDSRHVNNIEKEADDFALNALIPNDVWGACLSRFSLSAETVIQEAKRLRIHPSILAGRIRKENNNYTILNDVVGYKRVRVLLQKTLPDYRYILEGE